MQKFILPGFGLVLALAVGCAQYSAPVNTSENAESTSAGESTSATKPVNANCPIMGHPVADDGGSSSWNGKVIGYCCEGCKPKFEALSDEEKTAKLAEADKADHGDHQGHGDSATSGSNATEESQS